MTITNKTIHSVALVAIASSLTLTSQVSAKQKEITPTKPLSGSIIKKFDADKNGKLEGEEVKALHAAIDANKKEIEAAMIKRFDTDKDGTLSKKERKAAHKAIKAENKEIKAKSTKKFDKDGDGKLSGKERKGAKPWIKENYPDAIPKKLVPPHCIIPKL